MKRKNQGLFFNLEIFDRIGFRKYIHYKFEEKNLNGKEFNEAVRLINQAYGVNFDASLLKTPIGEEKKWPQNRKKHS